MTERARPEPYTLRDGLAVFRFGAGEPMLLMAWPHSAVLVGDAIATAFVEGLNALGRQVITFDPPGSGQSTRPMRFDMPEMLDCAGEALDAGGVIGPVDVIGHSQGGFTALAFAIERPARVRRLVLVGAGAGFRAFMNAPGALWNRSHPEFWRFAFHASLYMLLPTQATQKRMSNLIERASFVDRRLAAPDPVTLRDWLRAKSPRNDWGLVVRKLDYGPRLSEVAAPTLVMVGQHDPQMPPACSEELAAGIPDARLVYFERSGHYPFFEEREAFWRAVGAFLSATKQGESSDPP